MCIHKNADLITFTFPSKLLSKFFCFIVDKVHRRNYTLIVFGSSKQIMQPNSFIIEMI